MASSAGAAPSGKGGQALFEGLRENRSLLMGIAICGIALYHAPLRIQNPWLALLHDMLNCGVDMFLFLSGLGACHSISRRGGGGYLRQRAKRLLPGLYLFLIPWCGVMYALGLMDIGSLLGSVSLLGWWLGQSLQLNWYFSAVWMFFLLAIPAYRVMGKSRHPVLIWALLTAVSVILGIACPLENCKTAVTRLPIFFTGMLMGCLEQRGFSRQGLLRGILYPLMLLGLWLVMVVYWGLGGRYGYSLGLWWYPYGLVIPGAAVGLADLGSLCRKSPRLRRLLRPLEWCGESSAEILAVHAGIYKIIRMTTWLRMRLWLLVLLGCLALGCLYHYFLVELLEGQGKRTGKAGSA